MSKKISLSYHEKNGQIFRLARSNAIYLFLLLFFVAACFASPHFRSVSNITTLLSQSSIIGILAIGQTIVLITGGFDLSHGSFLALVSVLIAIVIPTSIFGAFLAAMVSLLVLGFVNGFFVNKGISPFIVTLGMQGIARTLAPLAGKFEIDQLQGRYQRVRLWVPVRHPVLCDHLGDSHGGIRIHIE